MYLSVQHLKHNRHGWKEDMRHRRHGEQITSSVRLPLRDVRGRAGKRVALKSDQSTEKKYVQTEIVTPNGTGNV